MRCGEGGGKRERLKMCRSMILDALSEPQFSVPQSSTSTLAGTRLPTSLPVSHRKVPVRGTQVRGPRPARNTKTSTKKQISNCIEVSLFDIPLRTASFIPGILVTSICVRVPFQKDWLYNGNCHKDQDCAATIQIHTSKQTSTL